MRWLIIALSLLLLSAAASGQDTGLITGTVEDKTGAVIPNAIVTISNVGRGINRTTKTNNAGEYVVPALPAGIYAVTISATGFRKYKATDVVLHVAQNLRADAVMEIGGITSEITVQGEGIAKVETQSPELAGTVTGKEITQLELNGRSFTQLVTLVPGVSDQTGLDEGTVGISGSVTNLAYSFNGGRFEYNNWEVDGGDIMDNGSNIALNVYPSIDAISEFRVLTSNYGAQYGRNGSGTVEVETKSGTDKFHGDVYEFVRNDLFNARNYFDDPSQHKPPYKKNDFGYTFGGPVYIPGVYNDGKDKSFFFWSQEWRKERVPDPNAPTFNLQVPSDAELMGNFGDVCPNVTTSPASWDDCPIDPDTGAYFANFQVPVDPTAQQLERLIPQANSGSGALSFFRASPSEPTKWREELLRVDHNVSPKLRATFRYIHDSWDSVTATTFDAWANFPIIQTHWVSPGVSMVARLTATVSPNLVNEFVMSYTADHLALTTQGPTSRPAGMKMGSLFDNRFGGKITGFAILGGAAYNGGFGEDPGPIPWSNSNPTYTMRDNVNKSRGRHGLQFGGYFVAAEKNESSFTNLQGFLLFANSSPVSTGNAWADMLLGRIYSFSQSNLQPKYYNRYKIFEPYFQDDWRISNHLTLNLGFRLSLFGTYRDRYKLTWNFDPAKYARASAPQIDATGALVPGTGDPFNGLVRCGAPGVPAGCLKGHLFNPAPRLGFAYDPTGKGKTAIRGAYGIFFEHTNGSEANTESLEGSPPLVLSPMQFNILGYNSIGGRRLLLPLNITGIPGRAIWPYMQQWHVDLQHEVLKNTIGTISYVGSKGTHLTLQRDLNQIPPIPVRLNPYKPSEPIDANGHDDCGTATTPSGVSITGSALNNLKVACFGDPNPFRPFSGYGTIAWLEAEANSNYNALQASLRRTLGALVLNVAYTYSHSIDNSSDRFDASFVNSYDLRSARASSNFDQRHLLNISYVYDLPFFHRPGFARNVLGGWQLSGITKFMTGTPFSVTNLAFYFDNAGVGNGAGPGSYPDLVGNPNSTPPAKFVQGITGPLLYNPNAFAAPRGLTFGNAGRNILRLPPRLNFDVGVFKHFKTTEHTVVEFRTEAFNVFNHTQWQSINNATSCFGPTDNLAGAPSCLNNGFLHPAAAHRPRTLQFGLKVLF
jgi:Carboxypeptidase regulatory-like domain